jgi:hypothetical protein
VDLSGLEVRDLLAEIGLDFGLGTELGPLDRDLDGLELGLGAGRLDRRGEVVCNSFVAN